MDKKMFYIGFIVGIFLIVGIGVYGFSKVFDSKSEDSVESIELAQLDLENLAGEKVTLTKGKPIIVNFWATWCAPCVQEFPEFEKIHKKYADKIDIVMISDESLLKIENFKNKNNYTLNMLRSIKPFDAYKLMVRPVTFVYNANGELVSKIVGNVSKEELEKEINAVAKN